MMQPSERDQERRVCDFALEAIAAHGGPVLQLSDERPDRAERNRKAIDFIAKAASQSWAVEHTRLDSYPNQTKQNADLAPFFDRVQERTRGRLPHSGSLHYNPYPVPRLRPRLLAIADEVARALVEVAPTLSMDPTGMRHTPTTISPPNTPLTVTVWREALPPDGGLILRKNIDQDDRPAEQSMTIRKALADKTPKLADARLDASLLVIETNDIQLANAWQIAEAVERQSEGFAMPTHIELVAAFPEPCVSWSLRRGALWYREIGDRLYST
jgi:hypothetical protein